MAGILDTVRVNVSAWAFTRALDLLEAGAEALDMGEAREARRLWRGHLVMLWLSNRLVPSTAVS